MNDLLLTATARFARLISLLLFSQSAFAVEAVEEIVQQKYAVDPDVTLSVHNIDGSIRVYAGDVHEISIEAIKRAYTSDRLKKIVISIEATSKSVVIETNFPPKENSFSLSDRSGTVEYNLIVPHTTKITNLDLVNGEVLVESLREGSAAAHITNGWLAAHNCFSDLNLRIENGRLDVAFDWWENTKFSVKLSSERGNIRAVIPSDASAGIVARTTTGRIANALDPKEAPDELIQSLDFATDPTPETIFDIKSTAGNIRIDKTY
jgi:DUF4097 and DUF4098 domain-containing protein YvlB